MWEQCTHNEEYYKGEVMSQLGFEAWTGAL